MEIQSYIYHGIKIFSDETVEAIANGQLLAFDQAGNQLTSPSFIRRNGRNWLCGNLANRHYCWYSCGCGGQKPALPILFLRRMPNGKIVG